MQASWSSQAVRSSDLPDPVVPARSACGPSRARSALRGPPAPTPRTADRRPPPAPGRPGPGSRHRAAIRAAVSGHPVRLRRTSAGAPCPRSSSWSGQVPRQPSTASHQRSVRTCPLQARGVGAPRTVRALAGTGQSAAAVTRALRSAPPSCQESRAVSPRGVTSTPRARSWATHQRRLVRAPGPVRARWSPSSTVSR